MKSFFFFLVKIKLNSGVFLNTALMNFCFPNGAFMLMVLFKVELDPIMFVYIHVCYS